MTVDAFVLDASVTLSWAFADETNPYSEKVLQSLSSMLAFVPAIWLLEVSNALLVAQRRGRIGSSTADRFVHLIQQLPVSVVNDTMQKVFGTVLTAARQYGLSAYDAAYLCLALELGLPLATRDEALPHAGLRSGVPLLWHEER